MCLSTRYAHHRRGRLDAYAGDAKSYQSSNHIVEGGRDVPYIVNVWVVCDDPVAIARRTRPGLYEYLAHSPKDHGRESISAPLVDKP